MVQAPVTKITGTFEPGHGMAQWFSRWCVHRWGRARRHKLTTAPNHDLQIEDWPEEQLAEKRQQRIATAIMKNNDQRFDDIQKTAFKSTRLSKILEIQATEESQDFVGIQDHSAE